MAMASNETGPGMVAASVSQVLDVTELRERILLGLSLRDLFVVQSVSRSWHDTIKHSVLISQTMFLQPSGPILEKSVTGTFDTHRIIMNPLSKVYQYKASTKEQATGTRSHEIHIKLRLPIRHGHRRYGGTDLPDDSDAEHSWKDMFLTQPPVSEVEIQYEDWREGDAEDFSLRCPTGVTLRNLRDHCLDLFDEFSHEPGTCSTGLDSFMGITVVVEDPNIDFA